MNHNINFEKMAKNIERILYDYVGTQTFTSSTDEKNVKHFFTNRFKDIPYFKEHPEYYGFYDVENDMYDRVVCWSVLKGSGNDTICMIHHFDTVGTADFKNFKDYALLPDELEKALLSDADMLSDEARDDLLSKKYFFGQGTCDMKGGGSIQYALMEEYSKLEDFSGNIVIIGVPDEENLSAGMRSAVKLLVELKNKFNFNYKLMINSEPHQRKNPENGVLSFGSIGKMMAFIYVRGFLSHAGKVFEGLNPVNVMSEIVRNTELNMDLADLVKGENAPAPTYLYLKDSKNEYDVSMPLNAYGCLSVLNLNMTPDTLIKKTASIAYDSFKTVIADMNNSYHTFLCNTGADIKDLPWKPLVTTFRELYDEAVRDSGSDFEASYQNKIAELTNEFRKGSLSIIECNFRLVDFVFDHVSNIMPRVVVGLVPPYYPCVTTIEYEKNDEFIRDLYNKINSYSQENFNQSYDKEYFYTGISDLSYVDMPDPASVRHTLEDSMPLFGSFYDLPLEEIHEISMPCINIGPWGKDFHKLTERVYKEDLLYRTPRLIDYVIKMFLE